MRKVSVGEAEEFKSGTVMTACEYGLGDETINTAKIEVHGRYPETGWAMNEESKQLCYILEGAGSLFVEGEEYTIAPEDTFLIQPGERFYWEANIGMLVTCTPAWTPEQYKHLEQYS
ncbi:MAG: cupin domain-containing protein [Patescibacteria group bacterium]